MGQVHECFFCGGEGNFPLVQEIDAYNALCDVCGHYRISSKVVRKLQETSDQAKISCAHYNLSNQIKADERCEHPFWLLKNEDAEFNEKKSTSRHELVRNSFRVVFSDIACKRVDHSRKPYELLTAIAKRLEWEEEGAFKVFEFKPEDRVRSKIPTEKEIDSIISYLEKKGYVEKVIESLPKKDAHGIRPIVLFNDSFNRYEYEDVCLGYKMTVEGWGIINDIRNINLSRKVFIAMQFEWEDNDERRKVYDAIQKSCADCGYDASVVNQDHTENITDKIISEIKESRFVIAEMTYNNRGVYFESGYARGIGTPVFHLVKKDHVDGKGDKKLHFDVQQIQYKDWENPNKLEEKLTSWIKARIGNYDNDNVPIIPVD